MPLGKPFKQLWQIATTPIEKDWVLEKVAQLETRLPKPLRAPFADLAYYGDQLHEGIAYPFGRNSALHTEFKYTYAIGRKLGYSFAKAHGKLKKLMGAQNPARAQVETPEALTERLFGINNFNKLARTILNTDQAAIRALPDDTKLELYVRIIDHTCSVREKYEADREDPVKRERFLDACFWKDEIEAHIKPEEFGFDKGEPVAIPPDEAAHHDTINTYCSKHRYILYRTLHKARMALERSSRIFWHIETDDTNAQEMTRHTSKVRKIIGRLPDAMEAIFSEFGVTVKCVPFLTKQTSEGNLAYKEGTLGDHLRSEKAIRIPLQYFSKETNSLRLNTDLPSAIYHELGHRLDVILGDFSDIRRFREAYAQDEKRIAQRLDVLGSSYYLSNSKPAWNWATHKTQIQARSEVFAEIFALEMLDRTGYGTFGMDDIRRIFPACTEDVRDVITRIENEYALFPKPGKEAILAQSLPQNPYQHTQHMLPFVPVIA